MAGALHSGSDAALELEGVAGDTAGEDFALFVEELLKELGVLVVHILDACFLEAAVFLGLGKVGTATFGILASAFLVLCHCVLI